MRAAIRLAILTAVLVAAETSCRSSRLGPSGSAGATAAAGIGAPTSGTGADAARAVVVLNVGGRTLPFRVELATTDAQRERGLMYRNHLDPDAGMLFVFERDAPLTFWMKNTFIPLDLIFIDSNRRIVGIVENAAPETETPRRVNGLSRYVLEIAGGLSTRLGITAGSTVAFEGVPAAP